MRRAGTNKFLVILVVVLLLTNAGMLWYFLTDESKESKGSRSERRAAYVQKQLQLDEQQKREYLALRATRDSVLNPMNDALREAKMKMLSYLDQPNTPDSLIMAAAAEIAARQQPIELEYFKYFRRLETLCRPDQLPLFDSLLVNLVNRSTNK
jgi:hypothetical protein